MSKKKKTLSLKQQFTAEYKALNNAIHRCHNPQHTYFYNYGARGIQVCPEWRNLDTGWPLFFQHVGPRPGTGYTLDRLDNNKGYEPGNVAWVLRAENNQNRRSTRADFSNFGWGVGKYECEYRYAGKKVARVIASPLIPHDGQVRTLRSWCDDLGLKPTTVRQRLLRGATPAEALDSNTSRVGGKRSCYRFDPEAQSPQDVLLDERNDQLMARIEEAVAILSKAAGDIGHRDN